jgi:DNA-binding NtrC family response regulator
LGEAGRPCAAAALSPHGVTVKTTSDLLVPAGTPIAVAERQLILATLDHFEGDERKVASALKISLKTLYRG